MGERTEFMPHANRTLQAYRDVRDGLLKRIRARFPVPSVPDL